MGNEVRIPINVVGEDQAARDLKKVGDQAAKTGDAIEEMGDQATTAGKSSEKAGEGFKGASQEAGFLDRQVIQTTAHLKALVTQLDRTGDTSLIKDIGKEKRNLRKFQNLAKEIAEPVEAAGQAAGGSLIKGLAEGFKTGSAALKGAGVPVLVGLAALAAPGIGAAIGAAVLGGVGAGGIAGGIALAAKDPAVTAAAEDLAAAVSAGFSDTAAPFVQPIVDSLDQLSTTGVQAAEKLKPGFDALSGTIGPLTDGIDGLVDNALPGVTRAMKAAAPVIRMLAAELPGLGADLGEAFDTLAEDPDGAILAMKALIDVTGKTAKSVADVVAWLSKAYEESARFGAEATGDLEDVFSTLEDWLPIFDLLDLGGRFADANDELEGMLDGLDGAKAAGDGLASSTSRVTYHTYELGVAADAATEALVAQREAMSQLVDLELAAVGGTIAFERAIDGLAEARKENGKTLDLDTEKGRANTEEILRGIEAVKENAEREYDLAIAHGATAQEAEKAAQTYRDKFGAELKAQIIKLFGNTKAVQALLAELDKLNGKRIVFTIVQQGGRTIGFKETGGTQLKGDEGAYRRAAGGPVRPGPIYKVGENGPELLQFGAHGTVTNSVQSRAAMSAGSAMAGVQVAARFVPGADALMNALGPMVLQYLQFEARTTANGSAEELIGTGGG